VTAMGMPGNPYDCGGAGRFEGRKSSKEGDKAYKPLPAKEETKTGQQSSLNPVYLSPYSNSESMQDGGLRILEGCVKIIILI